MWLHIHYRLHNSNQRKDDVVLYRPLQKGRFHDLRCAGIASRQLKAELLVGPRLVMLV